MGGFRPGHRQRANNKAKLHFHTNVKLNVRAAHQSRVRAEMEAIDRAEIGLRL